jgi:hypothetical protein
MSPENSSESYPASFNTWTTRVIAVAPNGMNTVHLRAYGDETVNGLRVRTLARCANAVYEIDPDDKPRYGHRHPSWTAPLHEPRLRVRDVFYSPDDGFMAAVYEGDQGDVVAFRGTDVSELVDIVTDVDQSFGLTTSQYAWALSTTKDVLEHHTSPFSGGGTPRTLTFTGHSLGGGLAACAALFSGIVPTVTFNAAGLHEASRLRALEARLRARTERGRAYSLIDVATDDTPSGFLLAYHVEGEPLTALQERLSGVIPLAMGRRVELPVAAEDQDALFAKRHGMAFVLRSLEEAERGGGPWGS